MGEEMTTMISIGVELDADGLSSSKHIFEQIASDSADVVLDLRRVNRMDGSGLGALMHVMKRKAVHCRRHRPRHAAWLDGRSHPSPTPFAGRP